MIGTPFACRGRSGRRATLPEIVDRYLAHRPIPKELVREEFVETGRALIERAERAYEAEG